MKRVLVLVVLKLAVMRAKCVQWSFRLPQYQKVRKRILSLDKSLDFPKQPQEEDV